MTCKDCEKYEECMKIVKWQPLASGIKTGVCEEFKECENND